MQAGSDLFADGSSLQLESAEKRDTLAKLAGDIYTVPRIRLPLLLRVDEALSGASAVYESGAITVEHVLPQTPRADSQWCSDFPSEDERTGVVHKLANLVLLTRRKNAQAGNLDFIDKKSKYFMSRSGVTNFALTSQILAESEWTPAVIARRQADILAVIGKFWRLS